MPKSVKRASPRVRRSPALSSRRPAPVGPAGPPPQPQDDFPIVCVGASAGGLEALTELVSHIPPDADMAMVVLQHLNPSRASMLRDLLARVTPMPVVEIENDLPLAPRRIYVVPPSSKASLDGEKFVNVPDGAHAREMPIDQLFQRLAEQHGPRVIGVVLSGSLSDGANGIRAVKEAGGITFAQDERSAKFPDMPRAAVATACVDFVLPPSGIAEHLVRLAHNPSPRSSREATSRSQADYQRVLAILKVSKGVNFGLYRQTTIRRRILRRMAVNRIEGFTEYAAYLRGHPDEVAAVYDDILIRVTSFFRDPETFRVLQKKVIPALVRENTGGSIRVWVPGCSTGEEAYSLAMCLLESLPEAGPPRLQIFGTDLSETAIQRARAGLYSQETVAALSSERRGRFFTRIGAEFQVARSVRNVCVFARQNVFEDPPFSNIDLLSCRNLLIYFEPVLQTRVVSLFHYALKPTGFLLLGTSESAGDFGDLFVPFDRNHRIFTRRLVPSLAAALPMAASPGDGEARRHEPVELVPARELERRADRLVLGEYGPPGVLVDDAWNVIQFRGKTGTFLESAPGSASLNVLKMAREGLLTELRRLLLEARKTDGRVRARGLTLRQGDKNLLTDVEVIPVRDEVSHTRCFLILFETQDERGTRPHKERAPGRKGAARAEGSRARLERELVETKDYLQSLIEELQAANEELKSSNEEILSANEELQSTNEELETTKEEIQSTNEELAVVNEELGTRNVLLSRALEEAERTRDFAESILETMREPLAVLGPDWKPVSINRAFREAFDVLLKDGRHGSIVDSEEWAEQVALLRERFEAAGAGGTRLMTDVPVTFHIGGTARHHLATVSRIRRGPQVLLALEDVSERRRLEADLRQAQRLESLGTLAGGVAHDFNNILNIVLAHATLAGKADGDPERRASSLMAIESAVKRGSAVVRHLLTFARRSLGTYAAVQLNDVVREVVSMLKETLPKAIAIETTLAETLPPVSADADQVHQALLNLCLNARDAMPRGGRLRVETRLVPAENVRRRHAEGRPVPYAAIEVSDNGVGMTEEARRRAFEPFFTTKPVGGGSGLGLGVVYGVVKTHQGLIEMESSPGAGTLVRLLFPVDAGATVAVPLPEAAVSRVTGTETLLVVEDEDSLREAIALILQNAGYTVKTASAGIEGVEALVSNPGVRLVLMDLGLPDITGMETYERMRDLRPNVRCIVVSGNLDAQQRANLYEAGVKATIRKPFQTTEMLEAVRRVLDAPDVTEVGLADA